MSKVIVNNYSVSGLTLLGIAFVVLKLTNVIAWSWWWVTLPFWGGIAILTTLLLVFLVIPALIGYVLKKKSERALKKKRDLIKHVIEENKK